MNDRTRAFLSIVLAGTLASVLPLAAGASQNKNEIHPKLRFAPALAQAPRRSAVPTAPKAKSSKPTQANQWPSADSAVPINSTADQGDQNLSGDPLAGSSAGSSVDPQFGQIKPFSQSAVGEDNQPQFSNSPTGFAQKRETPLSGTPQQFNQFGQLAPFISTPEPISPDASVGRRLPRMDATPNASQRRTPATPDQKQINDRIVQFVRSHMGQQVGDGECWSLAAAAMEAAGAIPPDDYNFGRELSQNEEWWPGDIIQFTSCVFRQNMPGGGWEVFQAGMPNHTAVFLGKKDGKVMVGQQNMMGDKTVSTMLLDFKCLESGTYKVYRTVAQQGM